MSPRQRCDEILRLIDEVIGDEVGGDEPGAAAGPSLRAAAGRDRTGPRLTGRSPTDRAARPAPWSLPAWPAAPRQGAGV